MQHALFIPMAFLTAASGWTPSAVAATAAQTGKIIVAVFVKKSDVPVEKRGQVIAEIARSIYDFYQSAE